LAARCGETDRADGQQSNGNAHPVRQELAGDVDYDPVKEVAGKITPVPGPMTITMLMKNTVRAAKLKLEA